jgi:hypothetical protein
MSDAAKPLPFNPTWLMVGIVTLSHVAMVGGWYRDTADLREWRAAQEKWNSTIERRLSDGELATGKTLVALAKDVEAANKTLASIQQALMVRPSSPSFSNQTP